MATAPDLNSIAHVLGGVVRGNSVHAATPGHSKQDRGTVVTLDPGAPDGCLVHSFNGGDPLAIKDELRAAGVLPTRETSRHDRNVPVRKVFAKQPRAAGVTYFEFQDVDGVTVCRKVRTDPGKIFTWQHPDGAGGWKSGRGCDPLFYRLPDLLAAPADAVVYIAEGEAKADKLAGWGLLATSSKDLPDDLSPLEGRTVAILPDNDAKGTDIAKALAERLEGVAGRVVLVTLRGLPEAGDIIDWTGTVEDLRNLTASALSRLDEPNAGITATPYQWRDPASLPRRPWLYGRQLLRGSVFLLVAPGATGKSALTTGMAMALCTGQPNLGSEVWGGPKRVWLWNLEDAMSDLAFSIQAAALHWRVSPADLDGRLFVDSGLDGAALKLAVQDRNGASINAEVSAGIVAELSRRNIDVLVIDPFISSHGLSENDNAAIDLVAKEWSRIAAAAGCAVVLVHHARKTGGEAVTAESSRGASSLVDAARGGLALNTMTEQEADRFGIDRDKRRQFFRADNAKANRAPAGTGEWFELVSVHLNNGPDGGDSVGVATPWLPPDPFDDVTTEHLRSVQAILASGEWRDNAQSGDWAGKAVAEVLGLDVEDKADKAKAASILKTWIKNGALRIERRRCAKRREDKNFVVSGDDV